MTQPAAKVAPEDTPLGVLLGMMLDRTISNKERIGIAKICLPLVHSRDGAQALSEPAQPFDICDPSHIRELIRHLAFGLNEAEHQGREIPGYIWDMMRKLPRERSDLASYQAEQMARASHNRKER